MSLWEFRDEVNSYRVPPFFRNLRRVKLTRRKVPEGFSAAAQVTGGNILADVTGHLGPPVALGDKPQRLEVSSVACNSRIVVELQDTTPEVLVSGDDKFAPEI